MIAQSARTQPQICCSCYPLKNKSSVCRPKTINISKNYRPIDKNLKIYKAVFYNPTKESRTQVKITSLYSKS